MGIIDRMMGLSDSPVDKEGWYRLEDKDMLDELVEDSFKKPVLLFKHSKRCGISSMAKWQLERDWDIPADELSVYVLDLITYRSISNEIADRFGVVHQSPQIILLVDGQVKYHTSHHMIGVEVVRQALVEG